MQRISVRAYIAKIPFVVFITKKLTIKDPLKSKIILIAKKRIKFKVLKNSG